MAMKIGRPMRVLVFFAANPDEELFTRDLMDKFDFPEAEVYRSLSQLRHNGFLDARVKEGKHLCGPGGGLIWSAGERLLKMIGR